jgi:hypothetical protein
MVLSARPVDRRQTAGRRQFTTHAAAVWPPPSKPLIDAVEQGEFLLDGSFNSLGLALLGGVEGGLLAVESRSPSRHLGLQEDGDNRDHDE